MWMAVRVIVTTHYPRLTQSLTLGLHLQGTQSGPITLRESLENVYVYPFLQRNFEGYQHLLSIFANLPLPHSYLTKLVCEHHIKASSDLLTVSTPCMRNYQMQGHTPAPGAVLSCFPRRLQPIVTLFYQHCHGCWLTVTLNWTSVYRSFLKVYPPLHLPHFHNCTTSPVSPIWSLSKKRLRILLSR